MNYYMPRQREDNGLWHYTRRNDGDIRPVAGCASIQGCPECRTGFGEPGCQTCGGKGWVEIENPCPGHETPEGARQHAAEYVIEHARYNGQWGNWSGCEAEGCDEPTKQYAQTGHPDQRTISLCDAHLNRETVAAIVGDELGDIYSSS